MIRFAAERAALSGLLAQPVTAQGRRAASSATPGPDNAAIWTLQDENASISTAAMSDRYCTNGLRLGWISPEGAAPGVLEDLGRTLWGHGQMRVGLDLSQQIYTAADITSGDPPLTDRPFAGVLLVTGSLVHDDAGARSVLALSLGVVAPRHSGRRCKTAFTT